MKPRHFVLVASLLACSQASAQLVSVYPSDIGSGTNPGWNVTQTSSSGSIGISGDQPRNGDGSLALHGVNGSSHWELSYHEGIQSGGFLNLFSTGTSLGLVSDLDTLSFDWLRIDNATPSSPAAPVFKLLLWDGNAPGTFSGYNTTYLTWEGAYNGVNKANHAAGEWHTTSILDGNFWQQGTHNQSPLPLIGLDAFANYHVVGVRVGFGSGWNNETEMYIDNVSFGFTGQEAITFNFNLTDTPVSPVPEPSTYGMIGAVLLLGLIVHRRRHLKAA